MYSSFDYESLEVKDWKGLLEFIEMFNKIDKDGTMDTGWNKFFKETAKEMINIKDKTITFEPWDNLKLISYWYAPYCIFLEGIAPYIEGEVHWVFENPDEGGYVEFHDGECTINTGIMSWNEWKPMTNVSKKELTKDMKKLIMLSKMQKGRRNK